MRKAEANERQKDEQMLAAIQSRPGRDTDTLKNEESNLRRARNMQTGRDFSKDTYRVKSDMNLDHSGLATRYRLVLDLKGNHKI